MANAQLIGQIETRVKTVLARPVSSDADTARQYYVADVQFLLGLLTSAQAEAASATGELRGVFLGLSLLLPENVTPEWKARMKAIYLEKGGELDG